MKLAKALSLTLLAAMVGASGCASVKPIPSVAHVDVNRFMGSWYVIAVIPSFLEKHEHNAIETYALRPDGRIQTTFRYRKGSFSAPVKTMHPIGMVRPNTGNAVWGMQFIWPIKAEYVIVDLKPDYSEVMIGRSKRDYLWIMARTPSMPQADYDAMLAKARALGYTLDDLYKVPQKWPEQAPK